MNSVLNYEKNNTFLPFMICAATISLTGNTNVNAVNAWLRSDASSGYYLKVQSQSAITSGYSTWTDADQENFLNKLEAFFSNLSLKQERLTFEEEQLLSDNFWALC